MIPAGVVCARYGQCGPGWQVLRGVSGSAPTGWWELWERGPRVERCNKASGHGRLRPCALAVRVTPKSHTPSDKPLLSPGVGRGRAFPPAFTTSPSQSIAIPPSSTSGPLSRGLGHATWPAAFYLHRLSSETQMVICDFRLTPQQTCALPGAGLLFMSDDTHAVHCTQYLIKMPSR